MSDNNVEVKVTGDASGAQVAMRQTTEAVKNGVAQVREHMESMTGVFEKVNIAMAGIAAVLAGGAAFREAVTETVKLTKEATALGKQFGITTTQASVLMVALDDVHVSTEAASTANTKITQTLRTNERAFIDMGIATRDSGGHLRSSLDLMFDVNEHLGGMKEGIDRNIEGQKIYGRSWSEVSGTLRLTRESMAAAQEKADELGLTIGERSVAQTKAYRDSMNDVGDVMTGIKKAVGDALLPILTKLGNWFASIGPQAVQTIKDAMLGLNVIIQTIAVAFSVAWNIIAGVVEEITTAVVSVASAISKALVGDFSGAKNALQVGGQQMVDIAKERAGNIAKAFKDAQASVADSMAGAFDKDVATKSKDGGEHSTGGKAPKVKKEKTDNFDEVLADLNNQMAAYKNNMDAKMELAQQALDYAKQTYGEDSAQYAQAQRKIVEITRQRAEQVTQIENTIAKEKERAALAGVAADESAAKLRVATGGETEDQLIAQEVEFENRRYGIKRQALQDALALAEQDPDKSPVKLAAIHAELEALEDSHQAAMANIKGQAAIEHANLELGLQATVRNGLTSTLANYLKGAHTITQGLHAMVANVKSFMIQALSELAIKQGAVSLMSIINAKREMIVHAALAAIHAAKSAAQIPFVGWALAIGAAVAVYAGLKSISSAANGYDIPAGVNPVTQLHEKEMVLPAKHADVIRGLADGGGAQGGGDTHHWNLHMIDGSGARDFIKNFGSDIAKEMTSQYRNGFPLPR